MDKPDSKTDQPLPAKLAENTIDSKVAGLQDDFQAALRDGSPARSSANSSQFISEQSRVLSNDGKLAQLEIVDKTKSPEPDSEDGIDVGKAINWSLESRQHARPKAGEGYYDVMKTVGADLLGRAPTADELQSLVYAAKALQEQRGKDSTQLNTRDELLPKNENEMAAFVQGLSGNALPSPLGGRQLEVMQQILSSKFEEHMGKLAPEQIVFDLKPVTDQAIVTKVVPNAVYIDSSNINGGQGYRRKPDCSPETQTYWLARQTADAFMKAQKWLIDNHHDPMQLDNMNAAGRRALDRELISKCAPGQPHATKHSQHEDGISVDVDNYDDKFVRQALSKFGFVHNVPGDRPHFTYLPKRK